jgi:AcrR family transcriptional regulator
MTRQRGSDTRAAIVAEGLRLMREEGPGVVTLDRVAEGVGVTKQAVLYHFGSKRGLLVALVFSAFEDEADRLTRSVERATSAAEAVRAFLSTAVDYYLADLQRFRAIYITVQAYGAPAELGDAERAQAVYPTTSRIYGALEQALAADPSVDASLDLRRTAVGIHFAAIGIACYAGLLDATGDSLRHDLRALTAELAEVIGRGLRAPLR